VCVCARVRAYVCVYARVVCVSVYVREKERERGCVCERDKAFSDTLSQTVYKRATQYRSLLWKMTYKDKGSYESPTKTLHLTRRADTRDEIF